MRPDSHSVSTAYTIRDATPGDAERLAVIQVQTFRETHGGGPSVDLGRGQWDQILGQRDPTDFTFVIADDGGEFVGFARGVRHDGGVPDYDGALDRIHVLRRCRCAKPPAVSAKNGID